MADDLSSKLLQSKPLPPSTGRGNRSSSSSSEGGDNDDDEYAAMNNPITPGEETDILIDKGSTGLGLSIVGGADTLLVTIRSLCTVI